MSRMTASNVAIGSPTRREVSRPVTPSAGATEIVPQVSSDVLPGHDRPLPLTRPGEGHLCRVTTFSVVSGVEGESFAVGTLEPHRRGSGDDRLLAMGQDREAHRVRGSRLQLGGDLVKGDHGDVAGKCAVAPVVITSTAVIVRMRRVRLMCRLLVCLSSVHTPPARQGFPYCAGTDRLPSV